MDFQYPPGERQSNTPTILRDDHNAGRVKTGLGCCMRSSDDKGQLVLTGTLVSHKHLRAQSSLSCDPSISHTQDKYINKVATRQYNRSLLHQQQRRHPLTRVDGSDNGVVDVVSQQKHLHSSRASARSTELPGGQSIEDMHRLDRLENTTKAHQTIPGRQEHRPLRYEADAQLPRYVSWHPDPKAIAADAFSLNWATYFEGLAFPPFNLIPRTLIKVLKDKTTIVLVAPVWQR